MAKQFRDLKTAINVSEQYNLDGINDNSIRELEKRNDTTFEQIISTTIANTGAMERHKVKFDEDIHKLNMTILKDSKTISHLRAQLKIHQEKVHESSKELFATKTLLRETRDDNRDKDEVIVYKNKTISSLEDRANKLSGQNRSLSDDNNRFRDRNVALSNHVIGLLNTSDYFSIVSVTGNYYY